VKEYTHTMAARLELLRYLFRDRGRHSDNWFCMRRWYWRYFYVFKTAVCILIDRTKSLYGAPEAIDSLAMWDRRDYFSGEYDCIDWTELAVGHGAFENWYYDVYRNGAP
jgi:hypothetical protein